MSQNKFTEDGYCFACGELNPIGLHLKFREENNEFVTDTIIDRNYQSFQGIVHGGIITTLMDEAMGGYMCHIGRPAFTARLSVRYRKPTPIGETLHIRGWIESERGGFVDMKAEISLADGTVTAEATAKMAVAVGEK